MKKTGVFNFLEISLCLANSPPLSVVMDLMCFLYGLRSLIAALATSSAFLPLGSFSMSRNLDIRSVMVRMKSLPFWMRPISKWPNSLRSSTSTGRWWMETLSGMWAPPAPHVAFPVFEPVSAVFVQGAPVALASRMKALLLSSSLCRRWERPSLYQRISAPFLPNIVRRSTGSSSAPASV